MFDKVVIVTRETRMDQLLRAFQTKDQARFYLAQAAQAAAPPPSSKTRGRSKAGHDAEREAASQFDDIQHADSAYREAVKRLRAAIPPERKVQQIDWTFLPTFLFGERDLVIALGQDGLVINIAKYLRDQPIVGVNPDPRRYDGVLLPFTVHGAVRALRRLLEGDFDVSPISIARASLDNGQELHGVNDIFIGPRSHISFRYGINFGGVEEDQSSSGVIVSTGCGSTGWFRSIIEGSRRIASSFDGNEPGGDPSRFGWDADYLYFSVREPFKSKTSSVSITFGKITPGSPLVITSHMAQNGVIFSDGIEGDYLEFNSGRTATVTLADRKAKLVQH